MRRDNATILFTTLVLQSSTMIFMIESLLCCHFHILVGIFRYRTWLVYSNDGLPQMPYVFVSKGVGCTPTYVSFVEPSYIYSSSASIAWQSLLTHIDIYRWASPQPIDKPSWCETVFSFLSSPQPPFYSTYSAMSMAHAHVLRED